MAATEAADGRFRRTPMILAQSPTNSPNYRRKQDKPEEMHVSALFGPKISRCNLLKLNGFQGGTSEDQILSLIRDGSKSVPETPTTKYGICFQRVTGDSDENCLTETLYQSETVSQRLEHD